MKSPTADQTPVDPAVPVAAEAPAAPAAPAAPGVAVQVPGAEAVPLEGLPTNAKEVQGLHARRDILRDQLQRAMNRREELVAELNRGLAPESREGIVQRMQLLDERILQIERDQAVTERLISGAPASVLASTQEEPRYQGATVSEEEAVFSAFAAFGVGIVITLVASRLRRRFGRRRADAAGPALPLTEDPAFERLSQAVDAIAVEVERIGEGQRFVTQVLASRREAPALSEVERR